MATATNKQKQMTQVMAALGKAAKHAPEAEARPVLEQFVYAVCREGTTREAADEAYGALRSRFFDWNEVRVSSPDEVADALAGLPDPPARAQRLIDLLQEVFETTFSFDLENLHKKGLKQAGKQLSRYQAASDFAVAWVLQHGLGGHALPLDAPALRVLRRLGLVDEAGDLEATRTTLEHQVPKAKGPQFIDQLADVAEAVCWADDPACFECPLNTTCPVGLEARRGAPIAVKKSR